MNYAIIQKNQYNKVIMSSRIIVPSTPPVPSIIDDVHECGKRKRISHHTEVTYPTHIFSSIFPFKTETEIMNSSLNSNSFKNKINFHCMDYNSLVKYCLHYNLHTFHENPISSNKDRNACQMKNNKNIDQNRNRMQSEVKQSDCTHVETIRKTRSSVKFHFMDPLAIDDIYNDNEIISESQKINNISSFNNSESEERLTKSELIEIVQRHFLTSGVFTDDTKIDELSVIQNFLHVIQNRRTKLRAAHHSKK